MEGQDSTPWISRHVFSTRRTLSTAIMSCPGNVQFLAGALFLLGIFDSAHASADFKKCCVLAARTQYAIYLPTLPWDVCAVSSNASSSNGPTNPSVNISLGWCEQNCPGHQPSSTSEWLHPIATWIIPYAGLLFLCPVGERGERAVARSTAWASRLIAPFLQKWFGSSASWIDSMMKWLSNVTFLLLEYGSYLGDPASAIWGAFSELTEDWWLSGIAIHVTELKRELLATVILAGQSEFDDETRKAMTNTLVNRLLLDIVGHQDSQQQYRSHDEKPKYSKSEVVMSVNKISPTIPPLDSGEVSTTILEKEQPEPLTTIELRQKLERSLEQEGEYLWNNVDTSTVAKALIDIVEGHDAPTALFSAGPASTFTTALDRVLSNHNQPPSEEHRLPAWREGTFTYRLWEGVRILLEARVDFVSTILIPVILMLVVTASVFYDAYQSLGDNDTAHSLAYGLLYSWLIILAVAANCYTTSLTYGLVDRTIGISAKVLSISPVTVRLRDRYTNALRWRRWLGDIGVVDNAAHSSTLILVKYFAGQIFGWACVAIVAACAAAISYSTPTVGIGCRSFNHLLYALISLIVCLVPVLLYWDELKNRSKYHRHITWLYRVLVTFNAAILLIGTILHLIGIFRSCRCMNLFTRHTRLLELNTMTDQAIHNATVYWLPVGYVAFIFIWVVSASAIMMRQVINFRVAVMQDLRLGEKIGHGKK